MNKKTMNTTSGNTTLGILGGGQLGRMSALAAASLGIKTIIYTEDPDQPAEHVAFKTYIGNYTDKDLLKKFAQDCDYISYEFENIPVETIHFLESLKPVKPSSKLLEISQHRAVEKQFLNDVGLETAAWKNIAKTADLAEFLKNKTSCIVKTARFGYDGKGQTKINAADDLEAALTSFKGQNLIAEDLIDFDYEVSVIVARDIHGKSIFYGPILNTHKNHILDISTCPANINENISKKALELTQKLADTIDLQGLLTVEFFVTKSGDVLANEIAPRTHNSGHYSIDACTHSQFENHVRAVCNLPVLEPSQHTAAKMINLIGNDVLNIETYIKNPKASVHLYGKTDVKKGRKMGHITILN